MSRLRPRNDTNYGYISRADGDQQLLNARTQESYLHQLRDEYHLQPLLIDLATIDWSVIDAANYGQSKQSEKITSQCLSSLRKLREAIISSDRQDDFAIEVFEITVRYAILHEHHASYFPAMQHLQHTLYSSKKLVGREDLQSRKQLLNGLLALHLCSIHEYREAIELRKRCEPLRDRLVDELIRALLHSNWHKWQALEKRANILQFKLLKTIAQAVSGQALAAISTAYMAVDMSWLCKYCGQISHDNLTERGWLLHDDTVRFKVPRNSKR